MDSTKDLPEELLCWNMISIAVSDSKSINLIIPNQKEMNILIKFLIEQNHINANHTELQEIKKFKFNREEQVKVVNTFLRKMTTRKVPDFDKMLLLYKIMRIRMKISYYAWRNRQTAKELILRQVMDSYLKFYPKPYQLNISDTFNHNFCPMQILENHREKER